MPSRQLRDLDKAAEPTSPSIPRLTSPPAVQHHNPAENTFSFDQSQLPNPIPTSPQHQRIKTVISGNSKAISPSVQAQQRPASSPSALLGNTQTSSSAQESYFSPQPDLSGIEARSPASKRAPASRSSHGIPTANGPPPALITQRSYHGSPWPNPIPTNQPDLPTASHPQSQSVAKVKEPGHKSSVGSGAPAKATPNTMNSNPPLHRQRPSVDSNHDDDDDTLRNVNGSKVASRHLTNGTNKAAHHGEQEDDHSYSSHEDLFLHLARADSEAGNNSDTTKKFGRRGSDFGVTTHQPSRTARQWANRPASSGREFAEDKVSRWSRSSQIEGPMNSRYSSPREQKYAASAHPLDQRNNRYLPSDLGTKPSFASPRVRNYPNRETSPELPVSSGRRQSIAGSRSGTQPRTYKNPARSHISGSYYDSSPIAHDTQLHQAIPPDGTESTTSTTAPSTVWDELDDLKSRIRKLELTGKLPSSSGAAIAGITNDRPRTATTTMTTASSSPRDKALRNVSPEASTVKGTDTSTLHPLLHSALAKAKCLIDPKAYGALESTASDALTLAAMIGATESSGSKTSAQGTSRINNRQVRRKADSMCRGLTELCIALSEEKTSTETPTVTAQRGSRESPQDTTTTADAPPADAPLRLRAASQDPVRPSSRIISRLEARRTSLLTSNASPSTALQANSQSDSPVMQQNHISTPPQPNPHPSRSSVPFHRRRTADSSTDTVTLHSRPGSRSTEQRPALSSRMSREYTSQHPLPTLSNSSNQHRSPSIQSTSRERKSYFPYYGSSSNSNSNNSPSTPLNNNNVHQGSRRYLSSSDRQLQTTPGSADENQRRAAERQQRIASLGQYSSGRRLRLVEGEQGRNT
ncbi:MAG: hypothetical protein Q9168_001654 [Polycauliona sp. 1 TL-2023]